MLHRQLGQLHRLLVLPNPDVEINNAMILREFIYFDRDHADQQDDGRYLSQNDTTVLRQGDLRKSRLTLRMINNIRKSAESHSKEVKKELGLVRKMYAAPPAEAAP